MAGPNATPAPETWRYVGENRAGETVRGLLQADSEQDALRRMQTLGLVPVTLKRGQAGFRIGSPRLSRREIIDFVRGLADLTAAGLPLKDALGSLSEGETRNRLKRLVERIEQRISQGDPLSTALRAEGDLLPRAVAALAEAGEASGEMARNFADLAEQFESDASLRQELVGQMIYPGVLVVLIGLTLLFLAHFVLPQFASVFASTRAPVPWETALVLDAGVFLRAWGHWIPVALVALMAMGNSLSRAAPELVDRWLAAMPVVGAIRLRLNAVRYCRVLGILLASGAPLARAEPVAREAVGSPGLRHRHSDAAERMRAGQSLSSALSEAGALPRNALRLMALGEKSGRLSEMLLRAAAFHDNEVRTRLKNAVELIGPVLIAILGICVGGVIAAVILGVMSLNDAVL
ncbi:type II secretion system F family protein [Maricaulis sp.]|uniref:type II secretion system F family protein n=1 Tax=Maricaulis sp. TaxID=1486257 RepID=UPI0025C1C084|nr:type II secretion system F family protein [Maricaulis sp.]